MHTVIIVSSNIEWQVTLPLFPNANVQQSPLGNWFETTVNSNETRYDVIFFHGGWGKIGAAASAQYIIDHWHPQLIVNLGTCGGFRGAIEQGEILLVEKVIVYDIIEQMTDPAEALDHYTTTLDLAWVPNPPPQPVRQTLIVSGDRDLIVDEVPGLQSRFGAVAGDWESGSIAWVAGRHGVRCLILRGVTDLVGPGGGDAYDGTGQYFSESAAKIMTGLVEHLPQWITAAIQNRSQ
jgi:adenosylhomocysteine nucleosidase